MKTIEELEAMLEKAEEMNNFFSMTYKEGLIAGIEWALGHNNEDPTE